MHRLPPRSANLRAPRALRPMAVALAIGLAGAAAQAQSLKELYEAARAYDATYLAARAQADSAQYKAAQSDALRQPGVSLGGTATTTQMGEAIAARIEAGSDA